LPRQHFSFSIFIYLCTKTTQIKLKNAQQNYFKNINLNKTIYTFKILTKTKTDIKNE